jgi:uncharacterized cysteine cluster protein YcgN (CxxCxxCC family)
MKTKFLLTPVEYQEKRYETAKSLLAASIDSQLTEGMEEKQRESLIFNCIQLTELFMQEIGYFPKADKKSPDETSVRKISDLLE